jgi:hypothetical protein
VRRVSADQAQHRLQQDDRCDAIDVVVAIDKDRLAIANRALDPLAGRTDAVDSGRIVQICERRSYESPVVVGIRDATTNQNVSEDRMDGKRDVRGR